MPLDRAALFYGCASSYIQVDTKNKGRRVVARSCYTCFKNGACFFGEQTGGIAYFVNMIENVHNRFYYYASVFMGLVDLENVTFLGDNDLEWGIIDEIEEPLQIDLHTLFGFFSNGMGTYVAIDYKNCENDNVTLWSAKDLPEYNINFWDMVDEWIVIGFEG